MSKAFYKRSAVPKLLHRYSRDSSIRSIEIWTTTCIVTNFASTAQCNVLINPSNPQLSGVKNFPYFPRGGPVPNEKPMSMHKDWQPLGYVSQWGGMEVGTGMMYPVSVVDGLVHQNGGWRLEAECRWQQAKAAAKNSDACPEGQAVVTGCGGTLYESYHWIVHTTPPFYKHSPSDPELLLQSCYMNAFRLAFVQSNRVASPLLGAGARGFPEEIALRIAIGASQQWCHESEKAENETEQVLAFGFLEEKLAYDFFEGVNQ